MIDRVIKVKVAEYKLASSPAVLKCLGLGSCVGVTIYDPKLRKGGLAHVLLPSYKECPMGDRSTAPKNPFKFADLAVQGMFRELTANGCKPHRLQAKIAGGANMFSSPFSALSSSPVKSGIGERNAESIKEILKELGVPVLAEDIGGNRGRTIEFDTRTGSVLISKSNGESCVL